MRVFVLTTGRSGSLTLSKALAHATNYTCAHESRSDCFDGRLDYPDRHIEVDNRLAFFLGPLHREYPHAHYVWLRRNRNDTVSSLMRRFDSPRGVMAAYAHGVVQGRKPVSKLSYFERRAVAELYVDTTEANIETFLEYTGVPNTRMDIEYAAQQLPGLWAEIGAEGDFAAACAELSLHHNAS